MAESINTIEGREALARIVRGARGSKKIRSFARQVGISHAVISRLEKAEVKNPQDSTLLAIARFTEHSFEELKAILSSRPSEGRLSPTTALEAWAIVKGLPLHEKALLGQMILAELGGLSTDL